MSYSYDQMQGYRARGDDSHPSHWDGYGGDNRLDWEERDACFSLDGSDLFIASPQQRLEELARDIEILNDLYVNGNLPGTVDWHHLEQRSQEIWSLYHNTYQEMAEEDSEYARAIQDWVVEELRMRHPDHQSGDQDKTPDELLVDLVETISVVDSLMGELSSDQEDPRLLDFASTWRMELLADVSKAEIRRLCSLAA